MIYRLLRRSELCPGASVCPYVEDFIRELPCDACPIILLDQYLASATGQAIVAALDLDFALQIGVRVELKDLRYTEFLLLRVLNEERNRHQQEQLKRAADGK